MYVNPVDIKSCSFCVLQVPASCTNESRQRLEIFRRMRMRMRHPEWSLIYQSAVSAPTAAWVRGQVSGEGGRNSKQREH